MAVVGKGLESLGVIVLGVSQVTMCKYPESFRIHAEEKVRYLL